MKKKDLNKKMTEYTDIRRMFEECMEFQTPLNVQKPAVTKPVIAKKEKVLLTSTELPSDIRILFEQSLDNQKTLGN